MGLSIRHYIHKPCPTRNQSHCCYTQLSPLQEHVRFHLMQWFYDSSLTKSIGTLNNLVHQVLLAPDFNMNDLAEFDTAKEAKCLNDSPSAQVEGSEGTSANFSHQQLNDGWIEAAVPISLPCDKVSHSSDASAPVFNVKGFLYRKPLEVIKAAFREPSAAQFHLTSFEEYWKPSLGSPSQRIYSELYNSNSRTRGNLFSAS